MIAKALLEFETLDAVQIKEIIACGRVEESAAQGESASSPSAASGRLRAGASRANQTAIASRRLGRASTSLEQVQREGL